MANTPREKDIPRIPKALRFFQVMAYITGTFLLLLIAEMFVKYMIDRDSWAVVAPSMVFDPISGQQIFVEPGFEIEGFGPNGLFALVPSDTVTAWNVSLTILIVHGWLYVVYLLACYRLWNLMRWRFFDFLLLALGGIVPVLSFILEGVFTRRTRKFLAQHAAKLNAALNAKSNAAAKATK
jgi:integral membrane protein